MRVKMDEVGELASVVGGWSCVTTPYCGLPGDTHKQATSRDADGLSNQKADRINTSYSDDKIFYPEDPLDPLDVFHEIGDDPSLYLHSANINLIFNEGQLINIVPNN